MTWICALLALGVGAATYGTPLAEQLGNARYEMPSCAVEQPAADVLTVDCP